MTDQAKPATLPIQVPPRQGYTYSSEQFFKEWRFSLEKDFLKSSGEPFSYAQDGKQQWGNELQKHPIARPSHQSAAVSPDGKYLAVGIGSDIEIFDAKSVRHIRTLTGYVGDVGILAFRPGVSECLVSSATAARRLGDVSITPTICLWDLNQDSDYHPDSIVIKRESLGELSHSAAQAVIAGMKEAGIPETLMRDDDEDILAKVFELQVSQFVMAKIVNDGPQSGNRLTGRLQKDVFSPSGKYMLYMPGKSPRSNDSDDWIIRIYSLDERKDVRSLHGHQDTIMWAGFNPDETLVGTCSWDRTFRIWHVDSGQVRYQFVTEGQNWIARFSPDGKYFAGCCGDGTLHVYDLSDGSEYMMFDFDKGWYRSLSWHPASTSLAVGGRKGDIYLFDIKTKQVVQHRRLSGDASTMIPENRRRTIGHWLEVNSLTFVDQGRKIAFVTSGDSSAEVYDLDNGQKWRFARAGTENAPDNNEEVTSQGGSMLRMWEDADRRQVMLITVDQDAVRLWAVPLTGWLGENAEIRHSFV